MYKNSHGKWVVTTPSAQQGGAEATTSATMETGETPRSSNSWLGVRFSDTVDMRDPEQLIRAANQSSPISVSRQEIIETQNMMQQLQTRLSSFDKRPNERNVSAGGVGAMASFGIRATPVPMVDQERGLPIGNDNNPTVIPNALYAHVPKAIRDKIQANEYVELHTLLFDQKRALGEAPLTFYQDKDTKQVKIRSSSSNRMINSWAIWEKAFRTFTALYVTHFPHRAVELMSYQNLIQNAAVKHQWEQVYNYDRLFRNLIAEIPGKRWDSIDVETYLLEIGVSPAGPGIRQSINPKKSEQTCRLFNKNKCGWGEHCRYVHKCSNCSKMGHNRLDCRAPIAQGQTGQKIKE
jgi:hypothetical protein